MKSVYITTNECEREKLDTERIRRFFQLNNCNIVSNAAHADIIYIGTCAFTQFKEDKSVALIDNMIKANKDADFIIGGCLPKINGKILASRRKLKMLTLQQINDIDRIAGFNNVKLKDIGRFDQSAYIQNSRVKEHLPEKIKRYLFEYGLSSGFYQLLSDLKRFIAPISKVFYRVENNNKVMVEISRGCLGKCSYCAVRFAQGELVSRPLKDIIREFKKRVAEGYYRIRLTAVESGCYGLDINTNFVELLKEILRIKGHFEITVDSLDPYWLIHYHKEILPILFRYQGKIILKVSIQSASNRILKKMNRKYTIEDVESYLLGLRKYQNRIKLYTSIIVGFPSETKQDFLKTKEFLKKINFDKVFIFKYSDRPSTKASELENKIDEKTKIKRMRKLEFIQMVVYLKNLFKI